MPQHARSPMPRRHTRQREVILQVIRQATAPLTVRDISLQARAILRSLGAATVYRTIKLLLETHAIAEVSLPSGEVLYEEAGMHHHHHFLCRVCKRVSHLALCPVGLPSGTTLPDGSIVEDHELTFYGLCSACAPTHHAKRSM
jgi:Fur family transcriptional regulator, ferric uptake regulator